VAGKLARWRTIEGYGSLASMRAMWALVATALVFGSGCAKQDWIDRTLVTVDVTGVWEGTQARTGRTVPVVFVLQQQGPKVTGEMRGLGAWPNASAESIPIQGTVNGDTLSLREVSGQTLRVVLQVNGDEMTGSGQLSTSFRVSLRRRPQ